MKLRKLMIVIEDTGAHEGKGFQVTLQGDIERLKLLKEEDMCPAEFWGARLMGVVVQVLEQTGAIVSKKTMPAPSKKGMH